MLGHQVYTLGEELLALLPLLTGQTDNSTLSPDATVVRIELKTLVERLYCCGSILLKQIHLGLHGISTGIF